jgi:hypothetical protein
LVVVHTLRILAGQRAGDGPCAKPRSVPLAAARTNRSEASILPPKPDASKPLTSDELMELQSKARVTGLSTVDVRRLLTNHPRLRRLVLDAACVLAPSGSPSDKREVYDAIKSEAKR